MPAASSQHLVFNAATNDDVKAPLRSYEETDGPLMKVESFNLLD